MLPRQDFRIHATVIFLSPLTSIGASDITAEKESGPIPVIVTNSHPLVTFYAVPRRSDSFLGGDQRPAVTKSASRVGTFPTNLPRAATDTLAPAPVPRSVGPTSGPFALAESGRRSGQVRSPPPPCQSPRRSQAPSQDTRVWGGVHRHRQGIVTSPSPSTLHTISPC